MLDQEMTTKERILKAAGDIFGKRGFKDTTIRAIALAAQVNVAAINYHFQDKERLYGTVLEDVFRAGFTRFPAEPATGVDQSPEQRLRTFIRAMFYRLLSVEGWGGLSGKGRLIARELLDPSPTFEAVLDKYIRPHKDLLVAIIIAIMKTDPGPQKLLPCAISIIGQCIYYAFASGIIGKISAADAPSAANIDRLADFVWIFSLGGIAKIQDESSFPPEEL
jgi:AcrR family transcriptional regulator